MGRDVNAAAALKMIGGCVRVRIRFALLDSSWRINYEFSPSLPLIHRHSLPQVASSIHRHSPHHALAITPFRSGHCPHVFHLLLVGNPPPLIHRGIHTNCNRYIPPNYAATQFNFDKKRLVTGTYLNFVEFELALVGFGPQTPELGLSLRGRDG